MTVIEVLQRMADARNAGTPLTRLYLRRADVLELTESICSSSAYVGPPFDREAEHAKLSAMANGAVVGSFLSLLVVIEDA